MYMHIHIYTSRFDDEELKKGRETVAQVVVDQFKKVLDKHRKRKPKWYNDDGRFVFVQS